MADLTEAGWTYGAELELADIDQRVQLPEGFGWDRRDYSMVNSNGIAVDPKGVLYHLGGEINTPPAHSLSDQVENLRRVKRLFPEARINHRCNLHIHVRVPGLSDNLEALKRMQLYIHTELKPLIAQIEPIPIPCKTDYWDQPGYEGAFEGAMWRYRRRRKSHQTFLTQQRLEQQLAAPTIREFFEREVPRAKANGSIMWHAQSRCAVNVRQLRETDTIEFRHFPGTLDELEMFTATRWCHEFLVAALLTGEHLENVWEPFRWAILTNGIRLPKFEPYDHRREVRYRLTCADGTVTYAQREKNILAILEEDRA